MKIKLGVLTDWMKKNGNRKNRKTKKRAMIAIVVLIALAGVAYYVFSQGEGLPVEAYTVEKGKVIEYVEDIAYAKSRNERVVYSDVSGVLKEVNVREGDSINVGDQLGAIEGDNIELQIKSLSSQLSGARASASYSFVESARLARDEAFRNLDNAGRLFEAGALSQDDYLKTQSAFEVAKQSYQQALSSYNSARAQADTIGYEIKLLENNRDKLAITSNEDTIVTSVYVKEGEYVTPGMPLFELGDADAVYLETDILVSDIAGIETGQKVLIDNEDIGLKEIPGTVDRISPKAISKISELGIEQKRVKVEIASDALAGNVRLGYEVDVKIVVKETDEAVRVPDNAVFDISEEPHVFMIEGGKTVLIPIDVIFEGNDYFAVENGISEGDVVVLSPGNEIGDGVKVLILEK